MRKILLQLMLLNVKSKKGQELTKWGNLKITVVGLFPVRFELWQHSFILQLRVWEHVSEDHGAINTE